MFVLEEQKKRSEGPNNGFEEKTLTASERKSEMWFETIHRYLIYLTKKESL